MLKAWQVLVPLLCGVGVCSGEKLLLIVLGGFRWDYFNIHTYDAHGFTSVFEEGIKAEYLTPTFPTLTYPNLYSIMTGLYPEIHGVVGDEMWDPEMEKMFSKGDNPSDLTPNWWDGGEPLWVTAARQGKRSYLLNWPSCGATIRGLSPTGCVPRSDIEPDIKPDLHKFSSRTQEALELLRNDSADFVGVYFEAAQHVAHIYTPNSQESKGVSQWLDNEVIKLMYDIREGDMEYDVNMLVVSDHGVMDIPKKKVIDLTAVVLPDDVDHVAGLGAVVSVWPKQDKVQEVFEKLKQLGENMAVYLKDDIPDRWHYRDNIRVAPITLVAHAGWIIKTKVQGLPKTTDGRRCKSYQGFDNNEVKMRGIFFGTGPNLKRGYKLPGMDNVNVYQLMCRILGIPAAPNNGTWSLLEDAYIKIPYRPLITWKKTFTYGPIVALVLVAVIVYYIKFREPSDKSKEV